MRHCIDNKLLNILMFTHCVKDTNGLSSETQPALVFLSNWSYLLCQEEGSSNPLLQLATLSSVAIGSYMLVIFGVFTVNRLLPSQTPHSLCKEHAKLSLLVCEQDIWVERVITLR